MMGCFQDTGIVAGGGRTTSFLQYHRLERQDDDGVVAAAASRRRRWWKWPPVLDGGKPALSCFHHVKKMKWSRIASALLPRKVAEFSSKIRHADATQGAADVCPAVVFMSPWGLPVLSRPLLARNVGRQGVRVSPWKG